MLNKGRRQPEKRINSQIAIASLALALGIIFVSLSYVMPGSDIFIIIIIPFLSAVVALKSDYRGWLLYMAGIILVSFIDLQEGFFQLLPNAMIGLIYGISVKRFSSSFFSYLIMLTASLIIEISLIYPINLIFRTDLISVYALLFGLDREMFLPIFPLFYLLLSLIQTLFSFIIVSNEMRKVAKLPPVDRRFDGLAFYLSADLISVSAFAIGFFYARWLSYLAMGYMLIIGLYQIVSTFRTDRKWPYLLYGGGFLISVGGGAAVISTQPKEYWYLSFLPFALLCIGIGLLMLEYNKYNKVISVEKETRKDLLG